MLVDLTKWQKPGNLILRSYLHVGGEELEKYASIDDGDVVTKKEPSPDEVPYIGVPVTPAPYPSSHGFYNERLPAPEGSSIICE